MGKISRREVIKGIGAGVGAVASPGILRAATKPLIIRRRWPFGSYDPAFCQNFEDAAIAAAALAPLLRFKPRAKDQDRWETEPHLVDSWTIGGGGKDYAFRLRDETWKASNSQIVSKDIAFSFGRLAAKNNLPNAYAARDIAKIQTPDPRSLQILMQSAVEAFDTSFLASGYAAILPEAQWSGRELSDFVFNAPDHIGAYDIEPKDSERVVLTANASWAGAKPKTDKIAFQVIQDDKAAESMSKHGYIDVFEVPRDFAAAGGDPPDNWTASSVTTGRVVYLALFPEGPSLRSPEARRGVQLSLDKEALARTVYGGQWATPASSLAPSGWVWTSEREALEGSAADAENFLRPLRDKTLNLAFLANLFPDPAALPAVAASIADGLRRRGVRVELIPLEWQRVYGPDRGHLEGLDMLLSRSSLWRTGVRDTLALFSTRHAIGSPEIDKMNIAARENATAELLRSIQDRLVATGAMRVLVEERSVWSHDPSIRPFFGPDGGVANLHDWARG